jgi:hypothetical protein
MRHSTVRSLLIPLTAVSLTTSSVDAQSGSRGRSTPRTGTEVLERMRAAYDGKWYHTLTFVQTTIQKSPNGPDVRQTWYETVAHTPETGTRIRIDINDPSQGNGVTSTNDSTWTVRGGTLQAARAGGNPFLPFIEGVYVQPVERTVREIAPLKVDMSDVRAATWDGRAVWVVGAAAGDTTSPQFWIDAERNVLLRLILRPNESAPPLDVHLSDYVPLGGGMLATKIAMYSGGVLRTAQHYTEWKADVPVDPALFDVTKWMTAKHWANK